jgi:hypothetical protein
MGNEFISGVVDPEFVKETKAPKPDGWTQYPIRDEYRFTEFLIDGLIPVGIGVISGATGVGKTTSIVPMTMAITGFGNPKSFLYPTAPRKVIYITEHPEQVEQIIYSTKRHEKEGFKSQYSDPRFLDWFNVFNAEKLQPEEVKKRLEGLLPSMMTDWLAPNGKTFQMAPLVCFDTISANFSIDNENDNSQVSKMIAVVKETCHKYGSSFWLTGHTSKADKRADVENLSARGANASEADANWTAYVFKDQLIEGTFFRLGKVRFVPKIRELRFMSDEHDISGIDQYGAQRVESYRSVQCEIFTSNARDLATLDARTQKDGVKEYGLQKNVMKIVRGWDRKSSEVCNKDKLSHQAGGRKADTRILITNMIAIGYLKEVGVDPKTDPRGLHPSQRFEIVAGETPFEDGEI